MILRQLTMWGELRGELISTLQKRNFWKNERCKRKILNCKNTRKNVG